MRISIGSVATTLALSTASPGLQAQDPPQTQTDSYTRYELQAPGSGAFRILYDVSATTPGATRYFNGIRAGAEEEVHGVTDLRTGAALDWAVVDGAHARANGHPRAGLDGHYIEVTLARPVPPDGQGRIRIDKTYVDRESYFGDGEEIVFRRRLGITRNAVVLPAGYELVECTYPCQVETEPDGRVRASFMSPGPAVDFEVRGRPLERVITPDRGRDWPSPEPTISAGENTAARVNRLVGERAFEDRDITYFLLAPETSSFRLFHDYTESRPGTDRYLNVVRAGSEVADPEAFDLDTGERLEVETLRGDAITAAGIDLGSAPDPDTEVVVIRFDPVAEGHSTRLRIWETYTDRGRYVALGADEFVWDRSFGRARNTVVLPDGYRLAASAIPGVIDETDDGRVRIRFVNPRPDQIRVFIRGVRR